MASIWHSQEYDKLRYIFWLVRSQSSLVFCLVLTSQKSFHVLPCRFARCPWSTSWQILPTICTRSPADQRLGVCGFLLRSVQKYPKIHWWRNWLIIIFISFSPSKWQFWWFNQHFPTFFQWQFHGLNSSQSSKRFATGSDRAWNLAGSRIPRAAV
jgi:hypothetical protein